MFSAMLPMASKASRMVGSYQQAASMVQHKIDQCRAIGYGRLTYSELLTAGVIDADGFEDDTSSWTVEGPPPGSPPAAGANFAITTELISVAASVTTEDTVLFGYGIEALATPQERAAVLGRAIEHLRRRGASR